jgi:hypothetical protein|nr:MAG TPA: hypothetical protein [Caudoviricetes sp.]
MKLKTGHRYFDITEKDRVMFNGKVYMVITQKYFRGWNYATPSLATNKAKKYIKRGVLVLCAKKYKGLHDHEYDLYRFDMNKLEEMLKEEK